MTNFYDAVVVGSGFGGAVAGCRLAQAGLSVAILERGRRYGKGEFPRNVRSLKGWSWQHDHGLFDVKPLNEITILQAAGWGGGSLVYANVQLRPPPDVFARGWPEGYSRQALDPYYDLVAAMLEVGPVSRSPLGLPTKALRMRTAARRLDRTAQLLQPNLAVDFSTPGTPHPNRFGVQQSGCEYCGECIIGCNVLAKNTLDLNYLTLAERAGAQGLPNREVVRLERSPRGYRVVFRNHEDKGMLDWVEATRVFLCAGAIGSTELLLRCRDQYGTLPGLSPALGRRYSGNGDFLGFGFDLDEPFEASGGPAITSGIVFDRGEGTDRRWFILEEGGAPEIALAIAQVLNAGEALFGADAAHLRTRLEQAVQGARATAVGGDSDTRRTALFFGMGRDRSEGVVSLLPGGRLFVRWDTRQDLPLYRTEEALIADIVKALGGREVSNPLWTLLRIPLTVHNLGGCTMAASFEDGVTDPEGQVHHHPGLYVLDGSILPTSTGVNPSHTIAAVAERNVERLIQRLRGNSWRAPERAGAPMVRDPIDAITVPPGGTAEPARLTPIGLSFTESWHGWLAPARASDRTGDGGDRPIQCTLEIDLDDLERFVDGTLELSVRRGRLRAYPFTAPDGSPISGGSIRFSAPGRPMARLTYGLPFPGPKGEDCLVTGERRSGWSRRCGLADLSCSIRVGHPPDDSIVATGVMRMSLGDLMDTALSAHWLGEATSWRRARMASRLALSTAIELAGGSMRAIAGGLRAPAGTLAEP